MWDLAGLWTIHAICFELCRPSDFRAFCSKILSVTHSSIVNSSLDNNTCTNNSRSLKKAHKNIEIKEPLDIKYFPL